jgi:virulence-associated protein VagC
MKARAKIFLNRGRQAVRLPTSFWFAEDQQEVLIHRVGRQVIIEPVDEWTREFLGALGAWKEPIERPRSRHVGRGRDPFD